MIPFATIQPGLTIASATLAPPTLAAQLVSWSVHLPAVAGLVTGLILLLFGARVLQPAFVLLCAAAGALLGSVGLSAALGDTLVTIPTPILGLAVGAIAGGLIGIALYRAAMAFTAAWTFATLGLLGSAVLVARTPGGVPPEALPHAAAAIAGPLEAPITTRQIEGQLVDAASTYARVAVGGSKALTPMDPAEHAQAREEAAEQLRQIGRDATSAVLAAWDRLPGQSRLTLAAGAIAAGLVGLFLGAIVPHRAAAVVTGLCGAGVFLASVTWLVRTLDLAIRPMLDLSPRGWLIAWACTAAVGIVVQMTSRRDKKDPPPHAAPATA